MGTTADVIIIIAVALLPRIDVMAKMTGSKVRSRRMIEFESKLTDCKSTIKNIAHESIMEHVKREVLREEMGK